jgi:hypothetical protein
MLSGPITVNGGLETVAPWITTSVLSVTSCKRLSRFEIDSPRPSCPLLAAP